MRSFSPGGVNYQIVQGDLVLAKDFIFFYDSGYIPKRKYPQSRMPFFPKAHEMFDSGTLLDGSER